MEVAVSYLSPCILCHCARTWYQGQEMRLCRKFPSEEVLKHWDSMKRGNRHAWPCLPKCRETCYRSDKSTNRLQQTVSRC